VTDLLLHAFQEDRHMLITDGVIAREISAFSAGQSWV
jgi:hypothetical protein